VSNVYLSPTHEYKGPKRSLILAGGGMRLAYQAGVLKAMEEEGLCFQHADGTSGGTINLAMLFSGLSPKEMCDRWRKLKIKEFVSYMPVDKYLAPANMMAFGDADGIVNKVFPHLGVNINSINRAKGMVGTFNVCNYTEKINKVNTNDQLTMDYLVAGISLPIFMPPVKIGSELYTDSVWIKDANLTEAVHRGAEEIWLVWAIGNINQYKKGAFNQYVHMIEISANGALALEFDYINELNKRILKGDSPYGQTKPIQLYVIKPEYPLPLDPDLYFNKINTATLIDQGYSDAKKYLKNQTPRSFVPNVTKMKDQGTVITYRQGMRGNMSGSVINIGLSVTIQDLKELLSADDGNGLQLSAHIQLPDSSTVSSAWNSFAKVIKENGTKRIQFQCNFQNENGNYFLESEINMNGAWSSLYKGIFRDMKVKLYQGNDQQGKLLGALDLLPDGKRSNPITGVYVLNEDMIWKKLKAKKKFIEFISA